VIDDRVRPGTQRVDADARRMMIAVIECRCSNVEVCTCGGMDPVIAELRNRLG